MYAAAMDNTIHGGFSMSIGYLCQWIFYAVFGAVSACCVPVSHADVLTRSVFRIRYNKLRKLKIAEKVDTACRSLVE